MKRSLMTVDKKIVSKIILNQNLSDPSTMLSGDINGEAIQWIRSNSHRYLGKYTNTGEMTICQLKDDDGTKYSDGTVASLTGGDGDVFMRLPQFFYKAIQVTSYVWEIGFSNTKIDSTWKEWDGEDLIGVYKAHLNGNKLVSLSGFGPALNISQSNFKQYARNRGVGYSLVKMKHHSIITLLYYAMYGNIDSKAIIGYGKTVSTTGQNNIMGMTDTTAGGSQIVNIWGLEGWCNSCPEWVDNVIVNPVSVNGTWRITEDNNSTRDVQGVQSYGAYVNVNSMVIGDHLDIIPNRIGGSPTTSYCTSIFIGNATNRAAMRSGDIISFIVAIDSTTFPYPIYGTRLAFRGNIVIEKDVQRFKSIAIIN